MRDEATRLEATRHRRARKRAEAAPAGFVTGRGLRERLGITKGDLRALTYHKVIAADDRNGAGYALYSLERVARLQALQANGSLFPSDDASTDEGRSFPYSAEDGVRVFGLLDQGRAITEVIRETKIHPLIVKRIFADFEDIDGSILLPKTVVDKINAMTPLADGSSLRDAGGVLELIELLGKGRVCKQCAAPNTVDRCWDCLIIERRASLKAARDGAHKPQTP
jgi:hypothetical protein